MKPEYITFLRNQIKLEMSDVNKSSNEHQNITCLLCGNVFNATPKSKVANYKKYNSAGCPKCSNLDRYSDIRKSNIKKLEKRFSFIDGIDEEINNISYIRVKNNTCSHIFTVKYGNLLNRNVSCPICNNERKRKLYKSYNDERHKNAVVNKKGFERYRHIVKKLTRNVYIANKKLINPDNHNLARSGTDGYHIDHIVSIRYCFDNNIPEHICAHPTNLRTIHWKENSKKWKKPTIFPKIFNIYINSASMYSFISKMKPLCDFEELKDFGDFVCTMYSESKKIALFFINFKIFNEKSIGGNNHLLKIKQKMEKDGVRSIFIFEDEFNKKEELVIGKIKHILQINNSKKIYARKCVIKEIDNKEKNSFLNKFHIQGTCVSQVNLGAYFGNDLIAVMTFSKPRILMNKKNSNNHTIELARFATHLDYKIVGISSKLLSYFKRNYQWREIYSFADLRWSNGNLYNKIGFSLDRINPPDYFYIINNERRHRWGYRKDALREKFPEFFDSSLTEYQNMLKMGYDRIWDCGTLKFTIKNDIK